MPIKAMDLFDAFSKDNLPKDKAYLISSFVNESNGYIIYEVISYSAVKAIYPEGSGITFQSAGKKMHILIEPASYPNKAIEPYLRDKAEQIPLRFSEVKIYTAKNQTKIMMAQKPIESLSSFTVTKPIGMNISFVFYFLEDIYETIAKFFEKSLNNDARIPLSDAKKAAKDIVSTIEKTMAFKADFG
jgi:hypothetical protein